MSRWLTRLRVEDAGFDKTGREVWRLLEPLAFRSDKHGDVVVPPDFRSNYVSVPRWPVIFTMAGGRASKEAALHDFPYTVRNMSREAADDLFLEALLLNPTISEGLAHTMHKAVRWFGASSWEDETNISQTDAIKALVRGPAYPP